MVDRFLVRSATSFAGWESTKGRHAATSRRARRPWEWRTSPGFRATSRCRPDGGGVPAGPEIYQSVNARFRRRRPAGTVIDEIVIHDTDSKTTKFENTLEYPRESWRWQDGLDPLSHRARAWEDRRDGARGGTREPRALPQYAVDRDRAVEKKRRDRQSSRTGSTRSCRNSSMTCFGAIESGGPGSSVMASFNVTGKASRTGSTGRVSTISSTTSIVG